MYHLLGICDGNCRFYALNLLKYIISTSNSPYCTVAPNCDVLLWSLLFSLQYKSLSLSKQRDAFFLGDTRPYIGVLHL